MTGESGKRLGEPPAQVTPTGIDPRARMGGYTAADVLIAGTAILISCISLYIATKQSRIMEKTLAASSWPLLQARTGNTDDSGQPVITIRVQNVGVGPAIVKSFTAEYYGKRTANGNDLIRTCCGQVPVTPGKFEKGDVLTNFIPRSVIRAGDDELVLQIAKAPKNQAIWDKLDKERFRLKYQACYCSILGTCWQSDLTGIDPKEVGQCPPSKQEPL